MTDSLSPNVPDITPDFVDDRPGGGGGHDTHDWKDRIGEADSPTNHRVDECVPNVPDVPPAMIGPHEAAMIKPARANADGMDADPGGLVFTHWLRWGYFAVSLAVIALFGLFVFSQAISALSMAAALPEWQRYALLIPLALCSLILLAVALSLVWSWFRLRAIRQIDISALDELKNRADTRRDGAERYQAARQSLEKYLRDYPLGGKDAGRLRRVGLDDGILGDLARDRDYLLAKEVDSHGWLGDYRDLFQRRIDKVAAGRVNSWALRAAGCVIASPLPLLDAILILAIALRMIKDLCVLYNVRTGRAASFLLFTRAVRNAFIAGLADEAGGAAGQFIGDEVSGMLGEGALGTLGASFAKVAAPKLGEGALNGLFMRRLGRATIRMLQPLRGN